MAKVVFAAWKKAVIEAVRVFFPAFLGVVALQFQMGVDLNQWQVWGRSLLISAVLAGIKAVAKWYRDTYGAGDYKALIYKLPI